MATRQLSVKFDTEGFSQAINQLQQTGKAFDTVLKNSQEAIKRAKEAQSKALSSGDIQGATAAQKQLEQAAKASSRAIAASYRELGIKSSDSINQLRAQAVSAFEAIKNSGTASARDIAAAQVSLNNKLKDLDNQLQGTRKEFTGLGDAAKIAFAGTALAIAGVLKNSLDVGKSASAAKEKLSTLTNEQDKLYKSLQGLSSELKYQVNATELAEAAYDVLSAGISKTDDVAKVLSASVKAAKGGFSELGIVSDATTTVINAYGKSANDAGLITDQFIQTQNDGKIVVAQYAQQIGGVASIAASAGVSLEELNAVLSVSTAAGVRVESAFTGTRQVISSILKPSSDAAKTAKELGIEFDAATLKSKGFAAILDDVRKKAGGNGEALSKLFGSVEALAAIQPVLGDFEKFNKFLDNQKNAAGAAATAFDKVTGGIKGTETALKNMANALQDQVFELFAPMLLEISKAASSNASEFVKNKEAINGVIAAIAALLAAGSIRAAIAAIQSLLAASQAAGGGLALLKMGLTALMSPANAASLGIGILAGTLIKFSLDAKQARADALALGASLDALATKKERTALIDLDDAERNSKKQLKEMEERSSAITSELASRGGFEVPRIRFSWEANRDLSIKSTQELQQESKRLDAEIQDLQTSLKRIPQVRKQIQDNLSGKNKPPSGFATRTPTAPLPPPTPDKVKATSARASQSKEQEYYKFSPARPTSGLVTSGFGMRTHPITGKKKFHDGVDYAPPAGTPVISTLPGKVIATGFDKGGYGNYATIQTIDKTGKKIEQLFGHLIDKALVGVGEMVKQGDIIGRVGSTGLSTGPHLHHKVSINGKSVNPLDFQKMSFMLPSGAGKPSDYLRDADKNKEKEQDDITKQQGDIRKEKIKSFLSESGQIIDTEKSKIIEESQQKIYDLKVQSLKADEMDRSSLEQEIRMQELLTNFQVKELELIGKQHQTEGEISILEANKVALNNEEKERLRELYSERKKITKELELANKESERAINLQQRESSNAKDIAIERLRGELEVILEKVIPKKTLEGLEKDLNEVIVSILQERNALNKKLNEASKLGDQVSFDKITEALKELDKQLPNFLNLNFNSIRKSLSTNIPPEDLKTYRTDDKAREEAILKTQQYYNQLRLDTELLIAAARKNGYTETLAQQQDLLNLINKTGTQQLKQIQDQGNILNNVVETAKDAFASGLSQLFTDLITGTKNLEDSFKSFAASILKAIADMAIQAAARGVIKMVLGDGYADGGYVSGPGTSRSDSIPARLSNGEFVMSANSVKHWGVGLLDNLNNRKMPNLAFESPSYNGGSNVKSATIVMNVNTPDANSFRRSETQMGKDAAEQLRRSMQRNG